MINRKVLWGCFGITFALLFAANPIVQALAIKCETLWSIPFGPCSWSSDENCFLSARMSDTGNLFVVNARTKMLIRYYPGNRGIQYYDLSQLATGEWNSGNFDFIPFDNDFIVIFYGNLYQYDLKTQVATPVQLIPDGELWECIRPLHRTLHSYRIISRVAKTNQILVCNDPKWHFKDSEPYIMLGTYGISIVDVTNGRMSLVDEIAKKHGEDRTSPIHQLLAGGDGYIYLGGDERFNFQSKKWERLPISDEAFELLNRDYWRNGTLEVVDQASNLYYGYTRPDLMGFIKVTPQGKIAWKITHYDLGIKIETDGRYLNGYLELLGVNDNGNLLIWSTSDHEKGNYQVHECSVQ